MAAPDDCETARLREESHVPTHQGRRVLPERSAPALAWAEGEGGRSPADSRRLLLAAPHKPLHTGLTLGLHSAYPQKHHPSKEQKTRFQKRKEKLIEALKPPYFILSMIIIMVCVHVWMGERVRGALEWQPQTWRRQLWRVLSYGAVHASHAHLALNALVALTVGWQLEREQGWWRVAGVWGGGVAGGAAGAALLQPAVKVVGASAAVYALLTAHLANVCLRFGHIPLWWFRPLSVVVLCASEGWWAVSQAGRGSEGAAGAEVHHVAWAAHLFGALAGVPLAFVVFTGENSKNKYLIAARIASALCLVSAVVVAVVMAASCVRDDT